MSKDIIVLTPNGRRQTIHCKADTSILQVLEDACHKHGFQPSDYDLKHHNHRLDLTTTIRFSNLPNKATVEMVETERKREEDNVTIGLQLEDGERRTADFPPHTSLYDLITSLAASEFNNLQNPCILYMRQEVTGEQALREKTLRKLGLIKGRAILRLLNKGEEGKQSNVSAIYRVPLSQSQAINETVLKTETTQKTEADVAGPSHKPFNPVSLIKSVKNTANTDKDANEQQEVVQGTVEAKNIKTRPQEPKVEMNSNSDVALTQENLIRRHNIEEEVIFLGAQKAIAFLQPDETQADIDDLPDDFYELTIEEVRKLYYDLQQQRIVLENTPMLTSQQRVEIEQETSVQRLSKYKNVVVRIQFPDRIILQGVFQPTDTVQDIINFVKQYLKRPNKEFEIFTTPLKENLDPKMTLLEARFVPCVHMHFKWLEDDLEETYLKDEIYSKITTSDAAYILASKYRAPTRRKIDTGENSKPQNAPSTSKNSKAPKWFKN